MLHAHPDLPPTDGSRGCRFRLTEADFEAIKSTTLRFTDVVFDHMDAEGLGKVYDPAAAQSPIGTEDDAGLAQEEA